VTATIYTFGPFELDPVRRHLRRAGETIPLSERQLAILSLLVSQAGTALSKDALIEAAWRDVAVTDNSLEQAISALRRALTSSDEQSYIQTVPRQGYRFIGTVARRTARQTDEALDSLLLPHRAWLEGRAAIETLGRAQASQARHTFESVLAATPDYAPAYVGLANACAFEFEATRADPEPDRDALAAALRHARDACRIDPDSAEAWATLGFVLHLSRETEPAVAAARRALALEPDNWRHHLRHAVVSWGEDRLRAAQRCLTLLPGLALAHWLSATVHVARQAFDRAEQELERGAQAQDEQPQQGRFSAVALHWLLGLVYLARGDEARALREFERELAFEAAGQLYARECCANTWYAIGAIALRNGRDDEAATAFNQALKRVPQHMLARVGLVTLHKGAPRDAIEGQIARVSHAGFAAEAAMAQAALLVIDQDPGRAAQLLDSTLEQLSAGSACWTVPVEPLLRVSAHLEIWRPVLARLRSRAA